MNVKNISLQIIIVNWNSGDQLRQCLDSIKNSDTSEFILSRVVVIDNASSDDSEKRIEDISFPISFIKNLKNRGFAAACNQGVNEGIGDYILFLNPDTKLYRDSLRIPLALMESQKFKHIGIAGIQLIDENGEISRNCARFPNSMTFISKMFGFNRLFPKIFPSHFMVDWDHRQTREVDQVMGAYFLVRQSVFEDIGGFDERFFVYFEDLDFSYRANKIGWKTIYFADVQAYHAGGGTSEQAKAMRLFYSLRSRILYGYKHFSWWFATALMLGTLLLEPFARLVLAALSRSRVQAGETLKGYAMLWGAMPGLFRSVTGGDR